MDEIKSNVLKQMAFVGEGLEVTIGSGMFTIFSEDIAELITDARKDIQLFFFDHDIEPKMELCGLEEMIRFMGINPQDGSVDIVKHSF